MLPASEAAVGAAVSVSSAGAAASGSSSMVVTSGLACIWSARHSAKRFINFAETSCITPRPNWAAGPVTRRSVSTCTRVPSATSSIVDVIVAAAVPCPRLSRACARMTARRAATSASSIFTVPL